jgi:hypothetical protein
VPFEVPEVIRSTATYYAGYARVQERLACSNRDLAQRWPLITYKAVALPTELHRRAKGSYGSGCPASVAEGCGNGDPSSGPLQMKWCRIPLDVVWTA